MSRTIAILTGGGDAPGLNAVLRAVINAGVVQRGWRLIGVEDAFNGLLSQPLRIVELSPRSHPGLLHRGGTVLGTTNRGDPFGWKGGAGPSDRSAELARRLEELGVEGLIVVGGDGTQRIARRLMEERGLRVVGVPKTIDNDLACTDYTFGFWSAVDVATEALDRLHTTAEAHDRVMLLEVMGRSAGWIALHAGIAGGADCIALPELPYDPQRFLDRIEARGRAGRHFSIIVVAEGARPLDSALNAHRAADGTLVVHAGGAAARLAALLQPHTEAELRVTVLGHLQRGGSPVPFDRLLATRMGQKAVELVEAGRWGELVVLRHGQMESVPLVEAAGAPREVSPDEPLLQTARAMGIELGQPA